MKTHVYYPKDKLQLREESIQEGSLVHECTSHWGQKNVQALQASVTVQHFLHFDGKTEK